MSGLPWIHFFFDILMVFLKELFKKIKLKNQQPTKKHTKLSSMQSLTGRNVFVLHCFSYEVFFYASMFFVSSSMIAVHAHKE